uniref:exodeoxyribonuclease III n=1 Tax=Phocoena sinus TaxID=42100 RepID=A0A8C9E9W1_PHOSS
MVIGTYISTITLNVNGLNSPTKRHRLVEWIQKQNPYIGCLQETHFRPRDTYRLKVREWKKIFHANGNQEKAGVAILSDKIDFKIKTVARHKEGHYIMIKGSIQEESITIINIYAPNICTSIHKVNANSHKREIESSTIIVGDFNTSLTQMDRSSRKQINKETQALNDTIVHIDLIDIYRTFHLKAEEYTFFSRAHGAFSRLDHILDQNQTQILQKERKLQINVTDKYRCKNPHQNTSKQKPTMH